MIRMLITALLGVWGIMTGIEGTIYVASGNRMPAPGHKPAALQGIRTKLYIYALTHISQADREGQTPYYRAIRTKLVKEVETDSTGHFCIALPPGRYSLFTKKNGLFYASLSDSENHLAPVEVTEGGLTKIDLTMEGNRRPVY